MNAGGRITISEEAWAEKTAALRKLREENMVLNRRINALQLQLDMVRGKDRPEYLTTAQAAELLQLTLNCLYALSRALCGPEKIKTAFETRLMCLSGYAPELRACAVCGKEPEEPALNLDHGCMCCRDCGAGEKAALGAEGLAALRYLCAAPPKQLLSFDLPAEDLRRLSRASERYLLRRTERGFATLDYWKKIRSCDRTAP